MRPLDETLSERPWSATTDQGGAVAARSMPRTTARVRRDGATSLRAVIASSAFLMLFATTTLVGGRAAIDPLVRSVTEARDTRSTGDIVYPTPDGLFCRHLSFDNTTAELVESAVGPCPDHLIRNSPHDRFNAARSFTWGMDK